ncbi:response regulator transcription factor [Luteibacter sp. UNCMF331Sha3.1]|uniref:response regulator n=1 Tax=Luteibacter sp. UNCMF331Sha3.1 TaxID=1502760 RepID=UPI000B7C995E|nr:response regulator transcription factor [Luteibacter sp. UNCMF331Sha3.1]
MTDRTRLLVVEDDPDVASLLDRYFSSQGFVVTVAPDGHAMRQALTRSPADLVLLDLGLPDEDGFAATRYLHEHWGGPVIIVTGKGEAIDRVVGLELGADDYVAKPFDLRELLARVRSVLRRSARARPVGEVRQWRFEGFRLDMDARMLTDEQGAEVPLTSGEFQLLCALVERARRVVSRDELLTRLHGRTAGPYDRAIDVQVARLRRKLERDPAHPVLVRSVRGQGYMFAGTLEPG